MASGRWVPREAETVPEPGTGVQPAAVGAPGRACGRPGRDGAGGPAQLHTRYSRLPRDLGDAANTAAPGGNREAGLYAQYALQGNVQEPRPPTNSVDVELIQTVEDDFVVLGTGFPGED